MIPQFYETGENVGLILIVKNETEILSKMLHSLMSTIDYPTHIFIQAIQANDETREILDFFYQKSLEKENGYISSVEVQWEPENIDLTKSLNMGIVNLLDKEDIGFIGWVHSDMLFTPSWLGILVNTMTTHQEIGKLSAFNNRDREPDTTELYEGDEQCYLVRRGVFQRIGLFDERFLRCGGYEDWDLSNRIREEGFKVMIDPNSIVWHEGTYTRRQTEQTFFEQMNKTYYEKKWGRSIA